MSYIIVWRHTCREPFLDVDSREFLETYSTFEEAKEAANTIFKNENEPTRSPWYFDYKIYEEATS